MPTLLVAGKYIPLPVTLVPVGISFAAVAVPVVAKLVPSKVSADPVVNTFDPFKYETPLAVPPFSVTVLLVVSVVKEPVFAAVPPMAGGLARYVENPVPETVLDALSVVKEPVFGVLAPTVPLCGPANAEVSVVPSNARLAESVSRPAVVA